MSALSSIARVSVWLLIACGFQAEAQRLPLPTRTITYQGQTPLSHPAINFRGDVTYRAELTDGLQSIWLEEQARPGEPVQLFLEGDESPFADQTFTVYSDPNIADAEGSPRALIGFYQPATLINDGVLWIEQQGTALRAVARRGDPAPGTDPDPNDFVDEELPFLAVAPGSNDAEPPIFNSLGQSLLPARVDDTADRQAGLWFDENIGSPGAPSLKLLARSGDVIPTGIGAESRLFDRFLGVRSVVNENGIIAFSAESSNNGDSTIRNRGIWLSDNGALPVLIEIEDEPFEVLSERVSINSFNQVAYLRNGSIWVLGRGELLGSDKFVVRDEQFLLRDDGNVVFIGTRLGNPGPADDVTGIFVATGGVGVSSLVTQQHRVPGRAEYYFQEFLDLNSNRLGQVAFRATLRNVEDIALGFPIRTGIFVVHGAGTVQRVAFSPDSLDSTRYPGDRVFLPEGGSQTIVNLSPNPSWPDLTNSNGADGQRRSLSESGHLAWSARIPAGYVHLVTDIGNQALEIPLPKGGVQGELVPDLEPGQTVVTASGEIIESAKVSVIRQLGKIRDPLAGETDEDYQQYVLTRLTADAVNEQIDAEDQGQFRVNRLPLVDDIRSRQRLFYTVQVSEVQSEELDLDANDGSTQTVYFTPAVAYNIKADAVNPVLNQFSHRLVDAIPVKKTLIADLKALGPNNYPMVEDAVDQWLDGLDNQPTPSQEEAIERAILAERFARSSIQFADTLLGTMLEGLGNLADDLIDELPADVSKDVAQRRKRFDDASEKLDLEQLRNGNFTGTRDPSSELEAQLRKQLEDLVEETPGVNSAIGAIVQKGANLIYSLVKSALEAAGVDPAFVTQGADFIKLQIDSMIQTVFTEGVTNVFKPALKATVKAILDNAKDTLVDGLVPFSYTNLTEEQLEASRERMEAWIADDRTAFLSDRAIWSKELTALNRDIDIGVGTILALSTSLSFTGEVDELLVEVLGVLGPAGRLVQKAVEAAKYLANGATFFYPFYAVYGNIAGPDLNLPPLVRPGQTSGQLGRLTRGVKAAYGIPITPSQKESADLTDASTFDSAIPTKASADIVDAVSAAQAEQSTVVTNLIAALEADDILTAIELTAPGVGESLLEVSKAFDEALFLALADLDGDQDSSDSTAANFVALQDGSQAFASASFEVLRQLESLFLDVASLQYENSEDLEYMARRQHVIGLTRDLNDIAVLLTDLVMQAASSRGPATSSPAIVVTSLDVVSDASGESKISATPESFTVTASVRNIGSADVANVDVLLEVTSAAGSTSLISAAEQAVGSLAANDGAAGGADEATVQWGMAFDGDPTVEERILVSVNLRQSSAAPVDFRPFGRAALLMPDIALWDSDLDAMPDSWESDNSLDPNADDSQLDPDGDGLSNARELDIGTFPQNPDSDGDNLLDGEEVIGGQDGFVTDPRSEDTDGDGTNDDIDGNPVDADSTTPPDPGDLLGEPELRVSSSFVALSEEEPEAWLSVSNSATGELVWTAVTNNEALIELSPTEPAVNIGNGPLVIRIAPGYELPNSGTAEALVRVVDAAGTDTDFQDIHVIINAPEGTIFLDDFE